MERDARVPGPCEELREVRLPADPGGMLWLTGLPDSETRLTYFLTETRAVMASKVVILTPLEEMTALAPSYVAATGSGRMPVAVTRFPIRDFGIPDDASDFLHCAGRIAASLRAGGRIVMHCRGGIGRTGMMAQAVLVALGMTQQAAERHVAEAGSHCETTEQIAFLKEVLAHAED